MSFGEIISNKGQERFKEIKGQERGIKRANIRTKKLMERYELPKGWRWVRLGEVAKVFYGKGLPKSERKPEGRFGVYGSNGIIDRTDKWLVDSPTIVIGRKGSVGALTLTEDKSWPIDTTFYLRLFNLQEGNLKYLFYALQRRDLISYMIVTAVPGINRESVEAVQIPLPSLPDQRRIVARIEELINRIEEAKRLRRVAREETDAIMPAALSQIYSRMKEEGVTLEPLGEVCELNPSRKGKMKYLDDMLVTFVPMSAVDAELGAIVTPEERSFAKVKKGYTWFVENDVLFAKITPCMQNGKAAIARGLLNSVGFGSTEFHVLRPRVGVLPEWVYFFVRRPSFRRLAEANFTGSVGQQRVPESFMKLQEIPLPSLGEQRQIVTYLDRLQAKVEELRRLQEETQEEIDAMTSAILDKAFRGGM